MKLCLAAMILAACRASAAQTDFGGASEAFPLLNKGAGARAAAMGSAFEALADDSAGAYFNPAGQGFAKDWELSLHHDAWLANTSRENLALLAPMGAWGAFAVQGAFVNYPALELRDSQGAQTGEFSPAEQALGLAWGKSLSPALAIGGGLRGLRQELPGSSRQDYAWNLGTLWKSGNGLGLAAVLRSLPQSGSDGSSHFFRYSLAAAYSSDDLMSGPLNAALSMNLDPSAPAELKLGIEKGFKAASLFSLRAGYGAFFPSYNLGPLHGLSAGAGLRLGGLGFDYAFMPFGSLGSTHQVSLGWRFDGAGSPSAIKAPAQGTGLGESSLSKEQLEALAGPPDLGEADPLDKPRLSDGERLAGASAPEPAPMKQVPPEMPVGGDAMESGDAPMPPPAAPELKYRVLSDGYVEAKKLEDQGKKILALAAYNKATQRDPDDLPSWRALAKLYKKLGKKKRAEECLKEVRRIERGMN